jgi:hypothetical protein
MKLYTLGFAAIIILSASFAAPVPAHAQTALCNPTAPLSDAWQHAEGSLTTAFLERGDIAGTQLARDYVWQAAHAPPLPDKWQHAEGSLTTAFLMRGDIEGALRVRGFLLAQMHDAGLPAPTCPNGRR